MSECGGCYSPDQYPGSCVEFSSCPSLFNLKFKQQQTAFDHLYVSLSQCGFSLNQPFVCCSPSASYPQRSLLGANLQIPQQPQQAPAPLSPQRPQQISPVQDNHCSGFIGNRIYGGRSTAITEMPFTAILGYSRREFGDLIFIKFLIKIYEHLENEGSGQYYSYGFYCGGALISRNAVLTGSLSVVIIVEEINKFILKLLIAFTQTFCLESSGT